MTCPRLLFTHSPIFFPAPNALYLILFSLFARKQNCIGQGQPKLCFSHSVAVETFCWGGEKTEEEKRVLRFLLRCPCKNFVCFGSSLYSKMVLPKHLAPHSYLRTSPRCCTGDHSRDTDGHLHRHGYFAFFKLLIKLCWQARWAEKRLARLKTGTRPFPLWCRLSCTQHFLRRWG